MRAPHIGEYPVLPNSNYSDIAYRYEIYAGTPIPDAIKSRAKKKDVQPVLCVKAFEGNWWESIEEKQIFTGTFTEFCVWAKKRKTA